MCQNICRYMFKYVYMLVYIICSLIKECWDKISELETKLVSVLQGKKLQAFFPIPPDRNYIHIYSTITITDLQVSLYPYNKLKNAQFIESLTKEPKVISFLFPIIYMCVYIYTRIYVYMYSLYIYTHICNFVLYNNNI